jgi:chitosanase
MLRSATVLAVAAALLAAGPAQAALSPSQRHIADAIVSVFENGTAEIQYCYIEDIHDGRGYTAGRAGFTTATADLLEVAERYTSLVPDNPLAPYLPRLREVARDGSDSTEGLEGLPGAWQSACQDPQQRAVQDQVVDETYFDPAAARARKAGLKLPLSTAILYDTEIQMGGGDDPDGNPALVRETTKKAGGTPRGHRTTEKRWITVFLSVRRRHLLHAHDPGTRDAWRHTTGRVDALAYLVKTGQWRQKAPMRIKTPLYDETLR